MDCIYTQLFWYVYQVLWSHPTVCTKRATEWWHTHRGILENIRLFLLSSRNGAGAILFFFRSIVLQSAQLCYIDDWGEFHMDAELCKEFLFKPTISPIYLPLYSHSIATSCQQGTQHKMYFTPKLFITVSFRR